MGGNLIEVDLKRAGIRPRAQRTARGAAAVGPKQRGIRVLEDGQTLVGAEARALVRHYGVETATVGLSGLGADRDAVAARIEDDDLFTVTAYHGVFLEMRETRDFPGVVIELAGLQSCVDLDGEGNHWFAEELPKSGDPIAASRSEMR